MSSSMSISNYRLKKVNDIPLRVYFSTHNVFLSLANSLRRTMMSSIPTATFDDTWFDDPSARSILIKNNTSALHNEWFAHRLSLVPLNMKYIPILTRWNPESASRVFDFMNPSKIPIISMNIKNDLSMKDRRDKDGNLEITTDDLIIDNADVLDDIKIVDLIPHDFYTNDPIILNLLKSNILKPDNGEAVELVMRPRIGVGHENSRNDCTGTVTFEFEIDSESKVAKNFKDYLDYQNTERTDKGLDVYTPQEQEKMRQSYELLDKQRVFKRRPDGQPEQINFSVESIGFYEPHQIVFDAITLLQLQIKDLLNCFTFSFEGSVLSLETNTSKVNIVESIDERMGFDFHIENEDHTLGNLIADYIKRYFCIGEEFQKEYGILKLSSYIMPHPLMRKIVISTVAEPETITDFSPRILSHSLSILLESSADELLPHIESLDYKMRQKYLLTMVFIKTCNIIISDLQKLKEEWTSLSGIRISSFGIIEQTNSDYLSHNTFAAFIDPDDKDSPNANPYIFNETLEDETSGAIESKSTD